jgi:cytidine deaminase
MKGSTCWALVLLLAGCSSVEKKTPSPWRLTEKARATVQDEKLVAQIFRALDAAKSVGTDPGISKFQVRAATVIERDGKEQVIAGGNTEYQVPEAIHAETSLLNHVTALFGPEATRQSVRFIAFYSQQCGDSLSCGDCRDYQMAATEYERLLVVCGQASDHTVRIRRFTEAVVREEDFPEVAKERIPLRAVELDRLVSAAREARAGGVTLFTTERHTGAAGLSFAGKIYRAAGADDAAFHYRYPVGGLLQQAATVRDYLMRAIVVVGEPGQWPRLSYRDRQYGYEASSFNRRLGKGPIRLILTDGTGKFRMTTFEEALPHAFSTNAFMPEAVDQFLKSHRPK